MALESKHPIPFLAYLHEVAVVPSFLTKTSLLFS